ncbi:hypothetical protein SteCoe_26423 [Stentor coeruleus]|uniref:14-3-3 domain-containing protein n=1 Tax=Stentor coeruleus TaxID=5963 RepID=A0A1R2BD96_9CILI|nr:hypothetical protein SteCoe_26423 [Stentor coeruleus]
MDSHDLLDIRSLDKEDVLFLIKIAKDCERYNDMISYVNEYADMVDIFTEDEIKLFEEAYKFPLNKKRSNYLYFNGLSNSPTISETQKKNLNEYICKISTEITDLCYIFFCIIERKLRFTINNTCKSLYLKLKADFSKYLLIIGSISGEKVFDYYIEAIDCANNLRCTDEIKLRTVLNFTATCSECYKDFTKVFSICRKTFDDAVNNLEQLNDQEFEGIRVLLESLRGYVCLGGSF